MAGGGVRPGLSTVAGTGDHAGDAGLVDDPPQRQGGRRGRGERREFSRGLDSGFEVDAGERLADVERLAVPVVVAMIIGGECRVLVVAATQQAGRERTRARIPTPAASAAGSTSSSGFWRNAFKMICTDATLSRAIATSACSVVSTLTP